MYLVTIDTIKVIGRDIGMALTNASIHFINIPAENPKLMMLTTPDIINVIIIAMISGNTKVKYFAGNLLIYQIKLI